jgi:hypothetical protein
MNRNHRKRDRHFALNTGYWGKIFVKLINIFSSGADNKIIKTEPLFYN